MSKATALDRVKRQLRRGKDVNSRDDEGLSLLHRSVAQCNLELVQFLADEAGADLFARTRRRATALHLVVENSRRGNHGASMRLIKFLLERGVKAWLKDIAGDTALHYVVRHCVEVKHSVALATRLLEAGARVDAINRCKQTPLHLAVEGGNSTLCKFLISKGADLEAGTKDSKTPLQLSVERCNLQVSHLLIQELTRAGKKIEPPKVSLLHVAIKAVPQGKCLLKLVKMLRDGGADIEARDTESNTPIHAALMANYEDCARLLIELGCSLNSMDRKGFTPLATAVMMELEETTKLLLARGADARRAIGYPNADDMDVLFTAHCSRLSLDVIRLILDCGAEDSSTEDYNLYLAEIQYDADAERMEYLIDRGADISETAHSFLWSACTDSKSREVAQLWLDRGADVARGKYVSSTLSAALDTYYDHQPIPSLLLNHLALKQSQGEDIGRENRETLDEYEPEFRARFESCLEELERMRATKIDGTKATLYDLLVKPREEVASLIQNERIVDAVKRNDFHHFDWNLRYVLRKARQRSVLIKQSRRFFDQIFAGRIPLELVGMIDRHLSDEDLRTVVRVLAWKEGTHPLFKHRMAGMRI